MSIFEAGLRGGAVAILLLGALFFLRDFGQSSAGRNRALYLLSAAGYVVCSAPGFARLDLPFGLALLIVSLGSPVLLWISAAAVFDHEFKPPWQQGFAWLGLVLLGLWSIFDSQPLVGLAYYALSLVFVGLAAWHTLFGRETHFGEMRRPNSLLPLASASYAAAIIVSDLVSPGSSVSAPFSFVNAIGLATLTFVFALSGLGIAREAPLVAAGNVDRRSPPHPQAGWDRATAAWPSDEQRAALSEALRALMEDQKLYRQQRLTISVLAARLGIPEYRLRRHINQKLGHRNFNSFVNGYRLAEARTALADPTQAEVPILTIALDAGFQSLAPFNRAFKATAGLTPSEYRRQRLSRPDPDLR
jgi:AraC-like DNA-binding protein